MIRHSHPQRSAFIGGNRGSFTEDLEDALQIIAVGNNFVVDRLVHRGIEIDAILLPLILGADNFFTLELFFGGKLLDADGELARRRSA